MGRHYPLRLTSQYYICIHCKTHLAFKGHLISRDYTGRYGRAALIKKIENVIEMQSVTEEMLSGKYIVRRVHCCRCHANVGWKYVFAYKPSEKYKEGAYILELNVSSLIRDEIDASECIVQPPITFLSSSL
ncbi:yippee-like protein [Schizosaccharomyces octosporus yFS286]|uniref:Protein yippee-like n=1 Tax=Schizosaccharomyces octosporus (strain yFS286) TaxID=483514 RepID=S9RGW3_SCHOY|nr:yippee-like protein [Schizosaccharomyces octosporus yFS286]EPX73299.1 yippee-like protein [Schizosaccharomyces octosporus yFS286]